MKIILCSAVLTLISFLNSTCFAQGQIVFNTRVTGLVDAPVTRCVDVPHTAQLFLVGAGGFLTPLLPTTTFREPGPQENPLLARYVVPVDVIVPNHAPGEPVTIRMRLWASHLGSYENAGIYGRGESNDTTIILGGGLLPPANLIGLFGIGPVLGASAICVPEPAALTIAFIGAFALVLVRRRD